MINKLREHVTSRDINAKINEIDLETNNIDSNKGNVDNKNTLSDFFSKSFDQVKALYAEAKTRLDNTRTSLNERFSRHYTKRESDDRFVSEGEKNTYLKNNREETIGNQLRLNGHLFLNSTTGPVLTFGNGSLDIRPGYLKLVAPNGKVPLELRDGKAYFNGDEVVKDLNKLPPGGWIELPGSQDVKEVSYRRVYEDNGKEMLILFRFRADQPGGHLVIDHIYVPLELGIRHYEIQYGRVDFANMNIKVTSGHTIWRVYYR